MVAEKKTALVAVAHGSNVNGIVQDLEGMITVDSSFEGTCFTVLLPTVEPQPQEESEDHHGADRERNG